MSHLLTPDVAERAVAMVLPGVLALMVDGTFRQKDLHIVVARPGVSPPLEQAQWDTRGILYEHSIGDTDAWTKPYAQIARSKCYLSWKHGLPTHVIQTRMPWLLEPGDTVFYGSAVSDGLVVAASGVQAWFDQMVSEWVLAAIRAQCIGAYAQMTGSGNLMFVPQP